MMPVLNARRVVLLANTSIYARAKTLMRRRGDSLLLLGVGVRDGFACEIYSDSEGNTPATPFDFIGLAIDAMSIRGGELFTGFGSMVRFDSNSVISTSTTSVTCTCTGAGVFGVRTPGSIAVAGTTNEITVAWSGNTAGKLLYADIGSGANSALYLGAAVSGVKHGIKIPASAGPLILYGLSGLPGNSVEFSAVSVKQISGINYLQTTTTNKPILQKTGNVYSLNFDGSDTLAAKIPAGYGAATVIYALQGGQVTVTNQNLSAAVLTIGPNLKLYALIVCRTHPDAADLALLQAFANKLAGV